MRDIGEVTMKKPNVPVYIENNYWIIEIKCLQNDVDAGFPPEGFV
jgi:hypothetical protein